MNDDREADLFMFRSEHILAQLQTAPFTLGYYTLRFYVEAGKPVNRVTDRLGVFYLYPSGGTLRDASFNIVCYDSRFDTYRGFHPPHLKSSGG
jgi:hypothetical protein